MTKGEATRAAILERATTLATTIGLEALSIGRLATELRLSKSGLFAHFHSKEALQVAVVETAAARFVEAVVRPALRAPRGEPRARALMERWMAWGPAGDSAGGCFFVAASAELDDQPGAARDALVQAQRDWMTVLVTTLRGAITVGHLRSEVDPEQMAFELYGVALSAHHRARLLGEPDAASRARAAIDRHFAAARIPTA